MTFSLKALGLGCATAVAMTAGSASAAILTLDFTDINNFSGFTSGTSNPITGNFNGVQWTLAATPKDRGITFGSDNKFNQTQKERCKQYSGLACDFDGAGISPTDELQDKQVFTLSFQRAFSVTSVGFLDLYVGKGAGEGAEGAQTTFFSEKGVELGSVATFGTSTDTNFPGYKTAKINAPVQRLSFFTTGQKDDNDIDFALAKVSFFSTDGAVPDPIPLPAGGVLLIGALGGLGLLRRRKKAA